MRPENTTRTNNLQTVKREYFFKVDSHTWCLVTTERGGQVMGVRVANLDTRFRSPMFRSLDAALEDNRNPTIRLYLELAFLGIVNPRHALWQ